MSDVQFPPRPPRPDYYNSIDRLRWVKWIRAAQILLTVGATAVLIYLYLSGYKPVRIIRATLSRCHDSLLTITLSLSGAALWPFPCHW